MTELSKQDVREVFVEIFEPFAKAVQNDFQKVNGRLDSIDGRLTAVEQDVAWMKNNFSELFTKLDKFITLYEKMDQEIIILGEQLNRLEERVAKLESQKII